jgi:transcriptional regulator NrdR family protein
MILKVIKKDGRIQEFSLEKIKLSIQRASDDMKKPINESDSNRIANTVNTRLLEKDKDTIEYKEIHIKVVETLVEFGFNDLADFYDIGKC